ncbi:hypothetical protein KAT63_02055 [Candidatus Parcubacteria bacterium]|nr:hypothetical protein [Candidatus Parcubacteria bacterium]
MALTVVIENYTKPKKIVTLEDFRGSKNDKNICDHCGRKVDKVDDENKQEHECKTCHNKFTGRILTCVNPRCNPVIFFWEVKGLTVTTCSQCGLNNCKEVLRNVEN